MEELTQVLNQFGVQGLTAVIVYKVLDMITLFGAFILIGWACKKAWPFIIKEMKHM